MKYFLYLIVAISVLSTSLSALGFSGIRAEQWTKLKSTYKYSYLRGCFDGLAWGDTTVYDVKLNTDITIEQYMEAIDTLYADYRNALLLPMQLLPVITLQLSGTSEENIEELLRVMRNSMRKHTAE